MKLDDLSVNNMEEAKNYLPIPPYQNAILYHKLFEFFALDLSNGLLDRSTIVFRFDRGCRRAWTGGRRRCKSCMVVGVFEGEQCPSIAVLWAPYAGGSHGNAVIEITVDYFLCTCRFPSFETFETLAKNAVVVRVTARGPSCFCLRPARICDKRQTRPSGQRRRKVSFRPSTLQQ